MDSVLNLNTLLNTLYTEWVRDIETECDRITIIIIVILCY